MIVHWPGTTVLSRPSRRGLGKRSYHVLGWDTITDSPLVSLDGHLGVVKDGNFIDVMTKTLYFDLLKFPWDLQKTAFGYFSASRPVDRLFS